MTALEFLFSLERLGMKFGLENMAKVCAALDHPERSFRTVIVAGTNGKGSVTAMTSAALHAAGHRTARYTSPHLERVEERFVIDEGEIGSGELEVSAGIVRDAVEGLLRDGVLEAPPTFFECATAIAFDLFRRAAVEVAVIEVGLGGRLDATNVITPMAAAITSIDFDHQELLGGTLDAIAREKAGVIKPGIPVVAGPLPKEAADAIEHVCRERGARYVRALDRVRVSAELRGDRTLHTFETARGMLADVVLALKGQHQSVNAAVTIALLEELDGLGVSVPDAARRTGLELTRWPGRLETVHWHGADVLLDAAHNPAGARALALYVREAGWAGSTLVLGVMRDKDAPNMLQPLLAVAGQLICTTPPSPRALPAAELADIAATLPGAEQMRVLVIPDPSDAIRAACSDARRVVAAGSIFLIGPLRGILR